MFIKDIDFKVEFSAFSERHFSKSFYKKYKGKIWVLTKRNIKDMLQRVYGLQRTDLIDNLRFSQKSSVGIFKLDFRIAGTKMSPKMSGNRVVFALSNHSEEINVLLVYGKGHCSKNKSENQWILDMIKENFPEYRDITS